jgi:hypothetical protein
MDQTNSPTLDHVSFLYSDWLGDVSELTTVLVVVRFREVILHFSKPIDSVHSSNSQEAIMAQDDTDALAGLVGFGLVTLVGGGIYKALKDFDEYKKAQLLNQQQAAALAERMRNYVPPPPEPNCSIHGADLTYVPTVMGVSSAMGEVVRSVPIAIAVTTIMQGLFY